MMKPFQLKKMILTPPLHSLPPSPIKGLHNELPITTLIELALFLRAERVENFPSSAVCVWVCV